MSAQQGQWHQYNKGGNASAMRVTIPVRQGQHCQPDKGNHVRAIDNANVRYPQSNYVGIWNSHVGSLLLVDSQESLTGEDIPWFSGITNIVTRENNTDQNIDRLINWQYLLPPIKLFYTQSTALNLLLDHFSFLHVSQVLTRDLFASVESERGWYISCDFISLFYQHHIFFREELGLPAGVAVERCCCDCLFCESVTYTVELSVLVIPIQDIDRCGHICGRMWSSQ